MYNLLNSAFCTAVFFLTFLLVSPDTSLAADSTVPGDFPTIQQAIDDPGTGAGDTITVVGTHVESNVRITKAVTIQGQGIGSTVIDASGIGGFVVIFFIDSNNVTLRDMTITGADQAVRFEMAGGTISNPTIENVSFTDHRSRAIELHNQTTVRNLLITECNFEDTTQGFRVSSTGHLDGAEFRDSTFTRNGIGIYLANDGNTSTLKNLLVTGCTFTEHTTEHGSQGTAIFLEEAQNTVIENNMFVDNRRDIQLFKWYQASIPVSNVLITKNTMTGTTDAVFAIFNAHHISGQTRFEGVRFEQNIADTNGARAVFAGAHSTFQNQVPSQGGLGWNTVFINCNHFTNITEPGSGVTFFIPDGISQAQALGGAVLNTKSNWWDLRSTPAVSELMQLPAVTDFTPILLNDDPGFLSVCAGEEPFVRAIPTISEWGYIFMALLFLGSSVYYIRFKRA